MVTTKKFGRVTAMLLALVMLLTLVPFQSFAASVPATDLTLKDGVTVAISSDMTEDQVKQALFNALVENPEGANWQDYEWEYFCEGKMQWNGSWGEKTWVSVNGYETGGGYFSNRIYDALKVKETPDTWPVRLAGGTQEVTIATVSSCTVNYNYDALMGSVLVNGAQVSGTVTGVSPAAEIQFTVVPNDGYKVASVTVNGEAVEAVDGVYTVLPVATTDINVTFEEEGTFYNVAVTAGDGVTVKMNGREVSGNVKVAEGVEYTFEYTPNDSTSVKAVKLGAEDVTSDVAFASYVGTQTLTFTGDTTLAVETVAKSAELVLTDTAEVPVAINADGSFNYDGIRANLISAMIDKAQSIGVDFSAANVTIEQYTKYYTSGDVAGVSSDWVPLEGKDIGAGIHYKPVQIGSNHLRIAFNGNDQYRPTDYIEFDVTLTDVGDAVIALKENPTVTLTEITVGNIDYSNLEQDIFDAAIDTASSLPADLTLEDLELTVPENITESGVYEVTARYPGSTTYREVTVKFNVQVNVEKLPTANIVLKNDTVSAVLQETSVGVYDNEALKEAVYAEAVDLDACVDNGLDTSKLVFEFADVTAEGQYIATVSYPDTETMHGASKTVTVNVTVEKLPTVELTAAENATVTLYKNYDRTYDYEGLKDEIFENVLTVANVDGLTRDAFSFQYKILDAMGAGVGIGAGEFYNFEQGKLGADAAGTYKYLNKGGNFEIKVSIPNGTDYYGATIYFNVNVEIGDTYVSEIVVNEGPFDLTLNMTRDRGYDYNALKQAIFDAAVVEVKNVVGEVNWDDLTYTYEVGLGNNFHEFEVDSVDGDLTSMYNYLREGGTFTVRLEIADGNGYYGSHVDITVNVTVADPFASNLVLNSEIAPVTLKETSVGVYDYDALKADIFAAAIDAANSTPANVALDACEVALPEINGSGSYNVTVKFLGSSDYNASSVSFDIQVNVEMLSTANIVLKENTVSAVLKETAVGVYDNASLKEAVYAAAVDLDACAAAGLDTSKLVFEFADVTAEGQYTATVSYPDTETMHGASKTVTVNVTVDKCPTVQFEKVKDSATLYINYDRTYNYDGLKEDIFNNVLKVTGVEDLQWSDFKYEYKLFNALGTSDSWSGKFRDFEIRKPSFDLEETYKYLHKGGNFEIKVSIPNGTDYYGSEIVFNLNVEIGDTYVSEIVVNEGPFDLTLNMTRDRGYDYNALKQAIFDAAVVEVKNVAGEVNWDDLTYTYEVGLGNNFHEFEVDSVDGDLTSMYNYLREGGSFNVRLSIADGNGFWGSHVDITVNVTVADPFATEIKLNSDIAPVTLKETSVGVYDYDALKADIFAAAIDAANSTPSNLTVDSFDFVIPEISTSGTYNVTANFKETYDNIAASVSFDIQVNVEMLPTATIALKSDAVLVELKETEVGVFDLEAVKKAVFEGIVDAAASSPALSYEDVTITFDKQITGDGKYTATIAYAGTSTIHGTSVKVTVDVDVVYLPTVKIETKSANLVLNKTVDGGYDYDGLKKAIFDECLRVTGVDGLSWDSFKYEYKLFNAIGTTDSWSGLYRDFEIRKPSFDLDETYKYLYKGGDFQIRVSIPDSSTYHGDSAELSINVTVEDPYYAEIALKENYQKDYVLNYAANGEFDYDRLEKEIFDAVIDLENSPANVSFDTATITYQILDGMGSSTGIGAGEFYPFNQGTLGADAGNTYKYLYKGGTFTIKVAAPATADCREVEVTFEVNVQPYTRVSSSVVLKSGAIDYTSDVNAIKEYIFNNLIDFNASKLPADVSIDDFTFEYYARNYTAGDILGVEHRWVPFEGMKHPTLAGSYFKQIGNGTNKIRVTFNGTDDYLASTSNEVEFTMSKASFSISLKQNYKYLDEALPEDFVQPSVSDSFEHFYFILDASSAQATVYLDSLSGIAQTDISVLPSIMFQTVLGRSAIEVYVEGVSRDELIKLINSDELAAYAQDNYNIDAAAINAMKDIVNSIPTSVTNIKFKEGQPTTPGTYTVFAMAANENYNTAFTSSVFYVKYHSTGTKLVFVQDTDGLNSFNVGDFDYSAVVTKDGVPVQSDNVRYIYTGFRSNALFYASTKEGPRQAGIYTQTAWTFLGTYAFPKTRTFTVSLL